MANAALVGIGFGVQQGAGGQQEAGGADAALEGGVFQERLLQGVQSARRCHPLDGLDLAARDLNAEDQARIDDAAVQHHGAGTAVAIVTSFLGAGHAEDIPQHLQQALARLAQEVGVLAVDLCLNVYNSGHPLASPGPLDGDIESAARQHADKVNSLADGTAHVVDGFRVGHSQLGRSADGLVVDRLSGKAVARGL